MLKCPYVYLTFPYIIFIHFNIIILNALLKASLQNKTIAQFGFSFGFSSLPQVQRLRLTVSQEHLVQINMEDQLCVNGSNREYVSFIPDPVLVEYLVYHITSNT